MQNLLYFLYGKAYINITNACTNACKFCVRNIKDDVMGAKLFLETENVSADDVIEQIEANKKKVLESGEVVFCGYGEPLVKFNEVIEVAKYIKKTMPEIKIRINTNGHANFIAKKNIVSELEPYVDSISISLNAQNEEEYNKISNPKIKNAYSEMLTFAKLCANSKIDTTLSIVTEYKPEEYNINPAECKKIADSMNAKFRIREWIQNGY